MKTGLTVPNQPPMISSATRSGASDKTKAIAAPDTFPSAKAADLADHLSTGGAEALHAALADHPEIRPEVVARGRHLAADPAYPSAAILRNISDRLVRSPDPSAEHADA